MTNEERLLRFLTEIARPTVREFLDAPVTDLRRGVLAAIVVNQLVEFTYNGRPDLHKSQGPEAFRRQLAENHADFLLLRNVAEATKHPRLYDQTRIKGIESIHSPDPQVFDRNGEPIMMRDGSPLFMRPVVMVDAEGGPKHLRDIVMGCFAMLEEMIARRLIGPEKANGRRSLPPQ